MIIDVLTVHSSEKHSYSSITVNKQRLRNVTLSSCHLKFPAKSPVLPVSCAIARHRRNGTTGTKQISRTLAYRFIVI